MPYCPECKRVFETGSNCPDHNVDLVDELPFQAIDGQDTTWVEITTAATEEEARLLCGFLVNEGIPAQVESLKFTMEPVNFGKMGEIRVYVASQDEQAALDLLQRRESEYDTLDDEGEAVVTDEGPAEIADDAQVGEGDEP
jgi:hypothetical protein